MALTPKLALLLEVNVQAIETVVQVLVRNLMHIHKLVKVLERHIIIETSCDDDDDVLNPNFMDG